MKTSRREFIHAATLALAGCSIGADPKSHPIPVILATDIGDDIDDTWALGFLLKCPELSLKLVATESGKSAYRAKLIGKFLEKTGHANIPIAVGPDVEPFGEGPLASWVKDYNLASYPGRVYKDGVGTIIDTIMHSPEPVTLICIGPMPNTAAALEREPQIAKRARLVGMDGSVRVGYGGASAPSAEWNVKANPVAARKALSAQWNITITPLDTCGVVTLDGEQYQRVLNSHNPVAATIIENYRIWSKASHADTQAETRSSVLYDPVAVYLSFAQNFCKMERLSIRVTDNGMTVIDNQATQMDVATAWNDLDGFRELLVSRLVI
jgi:inosine-uridine nucleoside N-ribohydrolase